MEFEELPTFSPELFSKLIVKNALKHKQYQKGINQLTDEGTIQVYRTIGFEDTILGVGDCSIIRDWNIDKDQPEMLTGLGVSYLLKTIGK
jgi:hypothetical protein